jgi:XTP/dITP diphosphohydrolase
MARIVLLVTSPRLPAGLLTAPAWDLVRAHPVLTAHDSETVDALRSAGADVTVGTFDADGVLAALPAGGTVVWLAGPTGDEALARELGLRLAREPGLAELELMYGSWDPPGARLLDAVTVMDRLASPGGDPWKHQQTHQSLARYLLEESYEAFDAIQAGDLDALREELGDVLLQVLLHARMAEDGEEPWSVDDVAAALTEKLIRRNPHVFSDSVTTGEREERASASPAVANKRILEIDEITANWERIKREEKARASVLDGVSLSQPALALAAQVLSRVQRAGLTIPVPAGEPLFALVEAALARGGDAEAELRKAVLAYADAVRAAEER